MYQPPLSARRRRRIALTGPVIFILLLLVSGPAYLRMITGTDRGHDFMVVGAASLLMMIVAMVVILALTAPSADHPNHNDMWGMPHEEI